MDQKILIVNTGSDSHKYAVYKDGSELIRVHLEKCDGGFLANIVKNRLKVQKQMSESEYSQPFVYFLALLKSENVMNDTGEVSVIGCRIVAPGDFFWTHSLINEEYLDKLRKAKEQAPLHIAPILAEIEEIKKALPNTKLIGVSDSEFHKDMPAVARLYSLPEEDRNKFAIYRYGYHGISVASIIHKLKNEKYLYSLEGSTFRRVIVCHLGSGSSVTAVDNGKSIDTSMGFTPLDGITMGSRVGNIDAGAAMFLGQSKGMSYLELENYFNTKCGLLGLSGKTKDVRDLIELETGGDHGARLALDSFAYGVRKYIGAYMAALGGLDLLVFTATIGERSSIMRERFCRDLEGLGISLDKAKNDATISTDGFINVEEGQVKIAVVTTDEMGEIMRKIS